MRRPKCPEHNRTAHCMEFDAYCCPVCFMWLEPPCKCKDDCEFAAKERPSSAKGLLIEEI